MRLIDAEKLEEYKADCCVPLTEWQEGWNDAIDTIMSETLTVDAEPVVHGEWNQITWTTYECSNCGVLWSWDGTQEENGMNFCPNCGADMRKENE